MTATFTLLHLNNQFFLVRNCKLVQSGCEVFCLMRTDPLRIIKEKQRDLLDLLDGRLFPEFGVLDIETHEIRT